MAEMITLGLFLAAMLVCVASGQDILWALCAGVLIFNGYGLHRHFSCRELWALMGEGMRKVRTIVVVFVLIGLLTAVWRASGTIPFIIYHSINLINPRFFVLGAFLLSSLMSMLTGTSFGTVGTMGVICMLLGRSMGLNPVWLGGAILSGCYFGDRGSPMSSSALLIASVTQTKIYENVVQLARTALMPMLLSCLFYLILGLIAPLDTQAAAPLTMFEDAFTLHWSTTIPALLIIIFSLLRLDVRLNMLISVVTASALALFVQKLPPGQLLRFFVTGYAAEGNPALAALLDGGGLASMLRVILIILVSASFFGIFNHTPLLAGWKRLMQGLARRVTAFGALVSMAVLTCMICCNQTLPIMLLSNIGNEVIPDRKQMAVALGNSVVVISALVPWSIASAVPLATVGADAQSLLFACFLYFVPLWNWTVALWRRQKCRTVSGAA